MDVGLKLDILKCEFNVKERPFFGVLVSGHGLRIDFRKIKAIINKESSTNLKEIHTFIDYLDFHQQFINKFQKIVCCFTYFIKEKVSFV